jgi:hypothetical protein
VSRGSLIDLLAVSLGCATRVWGVKCGVWAVKCSVWSFKCDEGSRGYEVWRVECEVWRVDCGVRCGKYEVWSVECGVRGLVCLSLSDRTDKPYSCHARQVAPFDFAAWQEACQSMFPKTLANLLEGKPAKMPKRFVETWQGFDHLPREQKHLACASQILAIFLLYCVPHCSTLQ